MTSFFGVSRHLYKKVYTNMISTNIKLYEQLISLKKECFSFLVIVNASSLCLTSNGTDISPGVRPLQLMVPPPPGSNLSSTNVTPSPSKNKIVHEIHVFFCKRLAFFYIPSTYTSSLGPLPFLMVKGKQVICRYINFLPKISFS